VNHAPRRRTRALITDRIFQGPEKKNPAVGTPGQIFFVIGVYGFKYAAWLLLVAPEGTERLVVIVQPIFCSCSSTFLFFSKVSKFNRTLCGFAEFSVRLRTHSSLGGDDLMKQDVCHRTKSQQKQVCIARRSITA
jgi:hypothetical protein